MTKRRVIVFMVIGVGILLVALQVEYIIRCDKVRKRLAGSTKTQAVIGFLAEGFRRVSKIENERPISTERIIGWIDDNGYGDVISVNHEAMQILDAWHMPITITYENKDIYEFVSLGPNRLNDNGQNDDIVRVFDVSGEEIELIEDIFEMERLDSGSNPG